jgi:hypothetical protein
VGLRGVVMQGRLQQPSRLLDLAGAPAAGSFLTARPAGSRA